MRRGQAVSLAMVAAVSFAGMGTSAVSAVPASGAAAGVVSQVSDDKIKKAYDRLMKVLPADWKSRVSAAEEKFDLHRSPQQQVLITKIERAIKARAQAKKSGASRAAVDAIDPSDFECNDTKLAAYVETLVADVNPLTLIFLQITGALDLPTYDALINGSPKDPDYALADADRLTTTFGQAQRFWDVPLNNVKLHGMHTNVFADLNSMASTLQVTQGLGPADAVDAAKGIQNLVNADPALKGGNHELFSLGAFAYSGKGESDPALRKLSDRIVVGVGMVNALKGIGVGRVGPQAVVSHEMAHHVQYEIGSFGEDQGTPEGTRRTELMADGFASYFGAHKKGMNATPSNLLEFGKTFYAVGDCGFDSGNHHGTPNQRQAASAWGVAVAAYAKNPNRPISAERMETKFEKILPELIAPDAPVVAKAYKSKVA